MFKVAKIKNNLAALLKLEIYNLILIVIKTDILNLQ